MAVDFDVIVDVDPATLPLGQLVALGRQRLERKRSRNGVLPLDPLFNYE
jgi:hypothetical protein